MVKRRGRFFLSAGVAMAVFFATTCVFADTITNNNDTNNNKDPFELLNRAMYHFNDIVDRVALKPIATLYSDIVPKPLKKGISNIFTNIDTVPTIINDVLQANFYQAVSDSWRLAINSTLGIAGFFDLAKDMGLEPNYEDFGLTLARWGYENSTYLVVPFLGPSTIRDALAWYPNYEYFTIYPYINPDNARYAVYSTGIISRRSDALNYESVFQQVAVDKYVFLRDAYLQRRAYLIQRNKELGNPYLSKNKLEDNAA